MAPTAATAHAARYVAVDTAACGRTSDGLEVEQEERRAIGRRLADAAELVARANLPLLGLGLLLAVALTAVSRPGVPTQSALFWSWTIATLALATGLLVPTAHAGWPRRRTPEIAASAASVALALAPWVADGAGRPLVAATAAAGALPLAVAFAVRPVASLALSLVPLACSLVLLPVQSWPAAVFGVATATLALLVSHQRQRSWTRDMRLLIELKARNKTLESERDAAWRTDREKSRFLAIASHDLRQPMHALGLFAATLQRRLQDSVDEPLARNLMRAVDGLERSFNALLDISKLDAGAVAPRIETFAIRDMFRRLHMQFAGQAEFAGLGLRFSPGGKSVTSDPQLLERVVGNLIHNAIKHTTHGGIAVLARTTRERINIEVWDTGCGIPADELPRIFDEFYQVGRGERDRTRGLGMGLAIVKRLALLLEHRLEVASTPGRGTMFRIGVPVGTLAGIQDDMAPADTQPMTLDIARMVLVVDDEEPIREGLRVLLHEWGYQVSTAADAHQAERMAAALEGRIDLVLSDLHLGEGPGGDEVIATVRRLCGREVPAILVTGNAGLGDRATRLAGGCPVLIKPVQARPLFEALRAVLRRD